MNSITLLHDTTVMYVTATSFPAGIQQAHEKLHSIVPFSTERKYFGISRPEPENHGEIIYRAAAEQMQDAEAAQLGLESLTILKGRYACITINDYMKDVQSIGRAFDEILSLPDLDPQGYCIEWYLNDNVVKCMVRLEE